MHYIPYVNSPELLKKAYHSARFMQDVTIIDNRGFFSVDEDPKQYFKLSKGHKWKKLDVSLTTAQIMNYMLLDSYKRGDAFFTWQHGDVEYEPSIGRDFEKYVAGLTGTDWGIIYTHHDLLAAYNVKNLLSINGWDQHSFPYYFLDNDIASRLDKAGFKLVISSLGEGIIHHSSATINSDPFRKYISNLIFPISSKLYSERHGDHQVTHIGAHEYS